MVQALSSYATSSMLSEKCIPSDWQNSYIVNLYKGGSDALLRGSYRGLRLMGYVMEIFERLVEVLIRRNISMDKMQRGLCLGVA